MLQQNRFQLITDQNMIDKTIVTIDCGDALSGQRKGGGKPGICIQAIFYKSTEGAFAIATTDGCVKIIIEIAQYDHFISAQMHI